MRRALLTALILISVMMPAVWPATMTVPAVNSNMEGVLVNLSCEVIDGQGRVLVTTDPYIGVGTQESERAATQVVGSLMPGSLENKDVIFIFSARNTDSIDGGSAGVAMAACLMSELGGDALAPGVSVTGGINAQGQVLQVSGILQKAHAASDFAQVVLIPAGQSKVLTYIKEFNKPYEGVYVEETQALEIDVVDYARENWNMSVVEYTNLTEAYSWLTRDIPARELIDVIRSVPMRPENDTVQGVRRRRTASRRLPLLGNRGLRPGRASTMRVPHFC